MDKLLFKALTIAVLIFAVWLTLSNIDWVTVLKVEKVTNSTEEKLGELFLDIFNESEKEINDIDITQPIDSILEKNMQLKRY